MLNSIGPSTDPCGTPYFKFCCTGIVVFWPWFMQYQDLTKPIGICSPPSDPQRWISVVTYHSINLGFDILSRELYRSVQSQEWVSFLFPSVYHVGQTVDHWEPNRYSLSLSANKLLNIHFLCCLLPGLALHIPSLLSVVYPSWIPQNHYHQLLLYIYLSTFN